jgi:putative tricarboxylic transport membrane protein
MSTAHKPPAKQPVQSEQGPDQGVDKAQYGMAVLLAALGIYTIIDATTLKVGFARGCSPTS